MYSLLLFGIQYYTTHYFVVIINVLKFSKGFLYMLIIVLIDIVCEILYIFKQQHSKCIVNLCKPFAFPTLHTDFICKAIHIFLASCFTSLLENVIV